MVVGQVKWFNAQAGFGFVTVGQEDVFVHHSEIRVGKEQFRYLVEGEYVELEVSKKVGEEKRQGSGITGIGGGRVMCEVRAAASEASNEYRSSMEPAVREAKPRESRQSTREPSARDSRPRETRPRDPSARDSRPRDSRPRETKPREKRSENVMQQMGHKPCAELVD